MKREALMKGWRIFAENTTQRLSGMSGLTGGQFHLHGHVFLVACKCDVRVLSD